MSVIEKIKAKAKTDVKHIVLAEGSEPRTVQAAARIVAEGLAKITLIGNPEEIRTKFRKWLQKREPICLLWRLWILRPVKRAKPTRRNSANCVRRRA